jgi:hypothetical protein
MLDWKSDGVPDRRRALVMGIMGGFIGAMAMRYYKRRIVPQLLPQPVYEAATSLTPDPQEKLSLVLPQYENGETPHEAAGSALYTTLTGNEPTADTRRMVGELVELAYLISAGAAYGGTRTSTRYRDIAGGFFMGLRMWTGEEVIAPLLGLRAGFTRFSAEQHIVLLTSYWVYTFVMAQVTRILYRVL